MRESSVHTFNSIALCDAASRSPWFDLAALVCLLVWERSIVRAKQFQCEQDENASKCKSESECERSERAVSAAKMRRAAEAKRRGMSQRSN
jgi:hypothetical protein